MSRLELIKNIKKVKKKQETLPKNWNSNKSMFKVLALRA